MTERLKVGTSVCLVPEHHTINLAKAVACLDRVANGAAAGHEPEAAGSFELFVMATDAVLI